MSKMLKALIVVEGRDYDDLAMACEHAAQQLTIRTPSENVTWEDKSHVDFDVKTIEEKDSYAGSCE